MIRGARMMVVALMVGLAHAADAPSIDSKVEQLGKMNELRVAALKQFVREGRMGVQAEIYNNDSKNQTVFWRVRWLDDSGIQVWDDEPWKQEVVYGNQRRVLQAITPTKKATDFRIELQSPDNDATPWKRAIGL